MKIIDWIKSIFLSLIVPLIWWAGGYNFDKRGPDAVFLILFWLWVFGFISLTVWKSRVDKE